MGGFGAPRRATVLVATLAVAIALLAARPVHAWLLDRFAEAELIIREQPITGVVVFVLLTAISAMIAFVSTAVLIPVAIYVWGPALCFILLWLGWFLGGLAEGWYLGMFVGAGLLLAAAFGLVARDMVRDDGVWTTRSFLTAAIAVLALAAAVVFGLVWIL